MIAAIRARDVAALRRVIELHIRQPEANAISVADIRTHSIRDGDFGRGPA